MSLRRFLAACVVVGAFASPSLAGAQTTAYAGPGNTNMRAGPGTRYPVVAVVLSGSGVNVLGCLSDYSWCDATVQGLRGWLSSTRLQFIYGGARVPVPQYRSYFRVPVVGFDLGYWDRYYRDRPFYRDRRRRDGNQDVYIDPDQFPRGGNTGGGTVYIDPDQSRGRGNRGGGTVYIDPDQNPRGRGGGGSAGNAPPGTVLGKVTDRPGYCYVIGQGGRSMITRCP